MARPKITRRTLGGATLIGVAAPVLVGCGSDEGEPTPSAAPDASDDGGTGLVAAAQVPVGGGVVISGSEVVVTQPAEGTFKCFTATCTHQGCQVGSVSDGEITCPCHGSVFSAEDGSVVKGPAKEPLEEFPVAVTDGQVTRT